MKKIILFLILGIFTLGLAGCQKIDSDLPLGSVSDLKISNKDASLEIKPDTLTNKGATVILTNKSAKQLRYGNPYSIEVKKDGKWYTIDVEKYFNLPLILLEAHESTEIDINWEVFYGKLPSGTYRIIKGVEIEKDKEQDKYETSIVAVEFKIDSD